MRAKKRKTIVVEEMKILRKDEWAKKNWGNGPLGVGAQSCTARTARIAQHAQHAQHALHSRALARTEKMRNKESVHSQAENKTPVGIDVLTGEPCSPVMEGIYDNYCVKKQMLNLTPVCIFARTCHSCIPKRKNTNRISPYSWVITCTTKRIRLISRIG